MSDREAMDIRESFIRRIFSVPTLADVHRAEAQRIADRLQEWLDLNEYTQSSAVLLRVWEADGRLLGEQLQRWLDANEGL